MTNSLLNETSCSQPPQISQYWPGTTLATWDNIVMAKQEYESNALATPLQITDNP